MTASQQRACAAYLQETYPVSQRRVCQILGRARSTLRYRASSRTVDLPLLKAIQLLARKHPRWGYRRIHARLEHQGWTVNLKRVRRLWRESGLQRPVQGQHQVGVDDTVAVQHPEPRRRTVVAESNQAHRRSPT